MIESSFPLRRQAREYAFRVQHKVEKYGRFSFFTSLDNTDGDFNFAERRTYLHPCNGMADFIY